MLIMRPARMGDLPEVQRLAADSPIGVTSLPDDRERLAEFGQGEAACGALHQLGPELGLKLGQLLADVGLGDPEPPRGGRDALLADQGIEDHHLGKTLQHGITRVGGGPPLFQSRPPGGRVSVPAPGSAAP